jgi:nucleotide-binding universal stress UspA family protein
MSSSPAAPSPTAAQSEPDPPAALFPLILVAVDPQEGVAPVPDSVWTLVRTLHASPSLCHVVMRPTSSAGNETDGSPANPEETRVVADLRASAVAALQARGREVPIHILHGDPGQRICEFADFVGADLIVLGPRRKGSLARSLKGSVSKYVVGNTRRNVLVLGD